MPQDENAENKRKTFTIPAGIMLVLTTMPAVAWYLFNKDTKSWSQLLRENYAFLGANILAIGCVIFSLYFYRRAIRRCTRTGGLAVFNFFRVVVVGPTEVIEKISKLSSEINASKDFLAIMQEKLKLLDEVSALLSGNINISVTGKFFCLEEIRQMDGNILICYSHKPKEAPQHNRKLLQHQSLSVPLALDESNFVMRSWFIASSHLKWENVKIFCSCEMEAEPRPPELTENLILIGSSKSNKITQMIMEKAVPMAYLTHNFYTIPGRDDVGIECLQTQKKYEPSPLRDDAELCDYALITRISNPFNPARWAFIFAGCKSAGQVALEHFFFDIQTGYNITRECFLKDRYQILIEVKYKKGDGMPELCINSDGKPDITILFPEELKAKPSSGSGGSNGVYTASETTFTTV